MTPRLRAHICDRELHERLLLRNEQTKQVRLPEVYVPHENAKKNVSTWMNAIYIGDAVPNILAVSVAQVKPQNLTDFPAGTRQEAHRQIS